MNSGRTIFARLMDFVAPYEFRVCVDRCGGHYTVQTFSCWDRSLCLAFAQLTFRESLRDIHACLRVAQPKLYHMGFCGPVAHRTLPMRTRSATGGSSPTSPRGQSRRREPYAAEDFGVELEQAAYALDATVIDLCLALFPWAKFHRRKAAVKLHTLLDLRDSIPTVLFITPGRVHDVNILDQLIVEAGAFYILDRGYLDFARLLLASGGALQ